MNCVEFSEWLTDKFSEWRGKRFGSAASVAEFARQFGASHQLVLEWMKKGGKKPKHAKYINALAAVYGDEVYKVGSSDSVIESTFHDTPCIDV